MCLRCFDMWSCMHTTFELTWLCAARIQFHFAISFDCMRPIRMNKNTFILHFVSLVTLYPIKLFTNLFIMLKLNCDSMCTVILLELLCMVLFLFLLFVLLYFYFYFHFISFYFSFLFVHTWKLAVEQQAKMYRVIGQTTDPTLFGLSHSNLVLCVIRRRLFK